MKDEYVKLSQLFATLGGFLVIASSIYINIALSLTGYSIELEGNIAEFSEKCLSTEEV